MTVVDETRTGIGVGDGATVLVGDGVTVLVGKIVGDAVGVLVTVGVAVGCGRTTTYDAKRA